MTDTFVHGDISDEVVPVPALDYDADTVERPAMVEITETLAHLREVAEVLTDHTAEVNATALKNARELWMSGRTTIVDTLDCLGLTIRSFAQYARFPRTRLEKIIDQPHRITPSEMTQLCDAIARRGSDRAERDLVRTMQDKPILSCRKSWTHDRDRRYSNKKLRGLK